MAKSTPANTDQKRVNFDELPIRKFHIRIAALTFGAHFNDGFAIGIIGMAIVLMVRSGSMELNALWTGAIGAGALFGLFAGALLFGALSDRFGRARLFTISFAVITVATVLQFFVQEPWQLLLLRVLLGIGIGGDYSVGHALLAEVLPKRRRGEILGSFSVVWTVGYVTATLIGIWFMQSDIEDAWRWMLALPAVFSIIILIARIGTPESPRWLMGKGRVEEARRILDRYFGTNVDLEVEPIQKGGMRELFSPAYRTRTVFNGVFWACLVMPYFAIYTFLPTILDSLGLSDLAESGEGYAVEIYLNLFLVLGALAGIWATARFTRRGFLIGGFIIVTVALALLAVIPASMAWASIGLLVIFSFALSGTNNLVGVFPAESFPTSLRAVGVGFATATSRLGSAISTFLLPVVMEMWGVTVAILLLAGVLAIGLIVSILWAPETKQHTLAQSGVIKLPNS